MTSGSEERDLDVWLAQKRWWAVLDLNQRPRDSRLCEFPHSVDYAFTMTIAGFRWVPSSLYTFNSTFTLKLGSALACAAFGYI